MNNNQFDKKRITVPIPKFKTSVDIKKRTRRNEEESFFSKI